ncbi:MAG: DUF1214 domain-containing protein [Deltaproteobacteria bacterium]|nr:DUF1214 domain-containing protein [Deltaproteobacteria bacterium]
MSEDSAKQRLMKGTSWEEFCDTLKMAGQTILNENAPDDPLTRAEGFRYLSRITRAAIEAFVEYSDPLAPVLFRPVHETAKMGADNPDNYYQWASVSGKHVYRITGSRGTIHYLGMGTYAGNYGSGGRSAKTGYLEGKSLQIEADGSFEIILSCEKQSGNWLPMEPDTSSLIVRQMFLDRQSETIADLKIERIDGTGKPNQLTPEVIDQGLGSASRLVAGAAAIFANWAKDFQNHTNQLPEFDQNTSLAAHGDPNICYFHSYWKLDKGEALIIEAAPPKCDYWNFQLNNHWMESLDYRHFNIAINKHSASYRDDGSVRIVVADQDPGVDNWIDTNGHMFGTMCFRWVRAEAHPQPKTRVVKVKELDKS